MLCLKRNWILRQLLFSITCVLETGGTSPHSVLFLLHVLTNFVLQFQSVSFLKVLHLLTVKNKQTNMLFLLLFQFIFKVRTLGSLSLAWVGEGSGVSLFTWAQKYPVGPKMRWRKIVPSSPRCCWSSRRFRCRCSW